MYAAGYVRVSTGEQYATPEVQEDLIRKECEKRGWMLIGVFKDIGVSGGVDPFERDGFIQAVKALEGRGGGIIVVYAYDRLFRSFTQFSGLLRKLFEKNIIVFSINESYMLELAVQNPQMYNLLLAILSWAASMERYMIKVRTRTALANPEVREKMKENFINTVSKLGYRLYEEIPEETKEAVVSLYRAGFSYKKIAKALNLSVYIVRKILTEKGVIEIDPTKVCPRCFHKMKLDADRSSPLVRIYTCENCGYEYIVTTRV